MPRVWGGRRLETRFDKSLPHGTDPIGELWELVDREEAQSVVHSGPLRGRTLHELWADHREEVFGPAYATHPSPRFPILCKLLDARERLSVQVHPPEHMAASLGGEPKTEMWYFLDSDPGATIYAGLVAGTTREQFEHLLSLGRVEEVLHRIPSHTGESIFIPSGRLHAIGEGNVIVEIQQNSDTTYRVFDWNRTGLDGQPRALHLAESMLSIDFDDIEPRPNPPGKTIIAKCPFFQVERLKVPKAGLALSEAGYFAIFTVVEGEVAVAGESFKPGQFFLVPAGDGTGQALPVGGPATVLRSTLPVW